MKTFRKSNRADMNSPIFIQTQYRKVVKLRTSLIGDT